MQLTKTGQSIALSLLSWVASSNTLLSKSNTAIVDIMVRGDRGMNPVEVTIFYCEAFETKCINVGSLDKQTFLSVLFCIGQTIKVKKKLC